MNLRPLTRYVTARDGTRIAWHTNLDARDFAAGDAPIVARPSIVLTNGIGTSANFWRHVIHTFSRDHRVLHWDYRGHGDSECASTGDYAITTSADDLIRVTEAAMERAASEGGRTEPPIHAAFSMGVAVLLEMYRRRPDLVRAMILVAGTPDAPGAAGFPFKVPGALPFARGVLRAVTPAAVIAGPLVRRVITSPAGYAAGRALGFLRKRATREDFDEFTHTLAEMDARAWWLTLRELLRAKASDVLPSVTAPVLVVAGSHDYLVPPSHVEKMRRNLPHARWVLVEDAGHAGLLEAGPEISAAIRLFVRDVDARDAFRAGRGE